MTEIKEYEAWSTLFRVDQQGKSPHDMVYQPVPEVSLTPYQNPANKGPNFHEHLVSHISHSMVINSKTAELLNNNSINTASYEIDSVYGINSDNNSMKGNQFFETFQPKKFEHVLPEKRVNLQILDFRNKTILEDLKKVLHRFDAQNNHHIWITPGHDFFWNIGLIRGIKKYQSSNIKQNSTSVPLSVYVPLQTYQQANESQLIALSNQLLSTLISGIGHFVWDLRNSSSWQLENLSYLLNVPEILVREGKILGEKDPIKGSGFFEELSDQVATYLSKKKQE